MCGRSEANSSPRLIPKPPAPPSHRRPSPRFPPEPCSQRQFPAQGTQQPHLGLAMSSSGRPFIFTAERLGERSQRQAIARQNFFRRFCAGNDRSDNKTKSNAVPTELESRRQKRGDSEQRMTRE